MTDDADITRYAFEMEPQFIQDRDGTWTGRYPEADWCVCAKSEEEVRRKFEEEFTRRQRAGIDPLAYTDEMCRRHLRDPIPGVYAMDNQLFRELMTESDEDRKRAFREAERRRVAGHTYTRADYEAEKSAAEADSA